MAGDWAKMLAGFGAGVQGRGSEYLALEFEKNQARQDAMIGDMRQALLLGRRGKVGEVQSLLQHRLSQIVDLGGDPSHTAQALRLAQDPNRFDELMRELEDFDSDAVKAGRLPAMPSDTKLLKTEGGQAIFQGPEGVFAKDVHGYRAPVDNTRFAASAKTKIYDNGTVVQAMPDGSTQVRGPGGKVLQGEERQKALQLARKEEVDFARNKAEATTTGSGKGERIQVTINEGLDAAKGAAVLRRGLSLLNSIETGGIDAARMKAKQLFGIESADEAELSSSLGKAVLSQLRATFGAQFTEREGARLAEIEAGFGKSTAGNQRLLNQTLQLIQRASKRGIDAAVESGDYRSAADIQELMDFQLQDEALMQQFGVGAQAQESSGGQAGQIKFFGV